MKKKSTKKRVIAYLHSHWDREWYREFEVFRLRLIRVFDNVLDLLLKGKIPSFYFDGQVAALLDYLEFRPEKEHIVRELIAAKKLFIGPFYTLVDEFLTDGICFRKNLEIGLKIAKNFGCEDFIGYFADTFGHSKNVPPILKEFGIDKAMVWRGVPDNIPSEFIFNGINTINLIRGYFMDIFSNEKSIKDKVLFLKDNLDKIAQKSGDTLLLPVGADHLGVPENISEQINQVNELLDDYYIELSSPFEYFKNVKFKIKHDDELRDNSKTFILPGCYSTRTKLKQLNTDCSYRLDMANKLQKHFGNKYSQAIEYAYKLLLQNQAHDSICGCSTDSVHQENIIRYNKILQITNTITEEIKLNQKEEQVISFEFENKYKILSKDTCNKDEAGQIIVEKPGFPSKLLYDTNKIPVTEDYTTIYTILKEFNGNNNSTDLKTTANSISNSQIRLEIKNGQINLYSLQNKYNNFIEFVRWNDEGDTYNYGPDKSDKGEIAQILSSKVLNNGKIQCSIEIKTSFFNVTVSLNKKSKLLHFKIKWLNNYTNKLWQVRFNLNKPVKDTLSEDMNRLISRKFDPNYNIREHLPHQKGIEAKTNTAPMQRFVWANGFGVITKGLCEYEIYKNTLSVTLLRSTGIISNPQNPARTTPAGPPIKVPEAQQLGENIAEFSIGFFKVDEWEERIEEIYPQTLIL